MLHSIVPRCENDAHNSGVHIVLNSTVAWLTCSILLHRKLSSYFLPFDSYPHDKTMSNESKIDQPSAASSSATYETGLPLGQPSAASSASSGDKRTTSASSGDKRMTSASSGDKRTSDDRIGMFLPLGQPSAASSATSASSGDKRSTSASSGGKRMTSASSGDKRTSDDRIGMFLPLGQPSAASSATSASSGDKRTSDDRIGMLVVGVASNSAPSPLLLTPPLTAAVSPEETPTVDGSRDDDGGWAALINGVVRTPDDDISSEAPDSPSSGDYNSSLGSWWRTYKNEAQAATKRKADAWAEEFEEMEQGRQSAFITFDAVEQLPSSSDAAAAAAMEQRGEESE
jgi:hypothetical protein